MVDGFRGLVTERAGNQGRVNVEVLQLSALDVLPCEAPVPNGFCYIDFSGLCSVDFVSRCQNSPGCGGVRDGGVIVLGG